MRNAYNIDLSRHIRQSSSILITMPGIAGSKKPSPRRLRSVEWGKRFGIARSLQDAFDEEVDTVREEGFAVNRQTLEALLAGMLERLEDAVARHDVPWFSKGIRRELVQHGIPVTKEDELDAFFSRRTKAIEAARFIKKFGKQKASRMAAGCMLFSSRSEGNLAGYSEREILASWKRLGLC